MMEEQSSMAQIQVNEKHPHHRREATGRFKSSLISEDEDSMIANEPHGEDTVYSYLEDEESYAVDDDM